MGLAGLGFSASSPLWALIALAIKREDGGPVFFRDRRVGQGGAELRRPQVPDDGARRGSTLRPAAGRRERPRVTRVGRLLRATAMDELPQLWNIFGAT